MSRQVDVGSGPDQLERRPFSPEDAEAILWIESQLSGDWAFDADDWYEGLAVLMAERAPA